MLNKAPPRLTINDGESKVPINKLQQMTSRKLTHAALSQPNSDNTAMVMTLASPGLKPGRGEGIALSST